MTPSKRYAHIGKNCVACGSCIRVCPRSWCAYCLMGTMTQAICQLKHKEK